MLVDFGSKSGTYSSARCYQGRFKAHLVEAHGYARQLVNEYRCQIDQAFGQVIPSPWDDLRQGLVLGGESLWNRARELLDQAGGHEEIRWRRRADGDEVSRLVASLVAQEPDRRVPFGCGSVWAASG